MSEIIGSTYEILEKIGSGGGGNVFLANHQRLNKKVVLKADKREITTSPELLRREVDVLKNLSHTYIPQVYDFFIENGTVYTVMDYIEGESLNKPLKRGERFSQPQVIQWAKQLLEALRYLHSETHGTPPRGFVHSDIKPANLMRTPDNNICLIDFNIALALGEQNVIGCSAGYASPEHYGLDFSTGSDTTSTENRVTTFVGNGSKTGSSGEMTENSSKPSKKVIVPDVRSDIYSTGATLYHLLSGRCPSSNAKEVIPLSEKEFSPQIVKIITKAMNPNPDLRYQTADAMLWDFSHLRENDPRVRRQKRNRLFIGIFLFLLFSSGAASAFVGLKRLQTTESWLKLAEYSKTALAEQNPSAAIDYALQALPERTSIFQPAHPAKAQEALTEALKVYDLSDGFKLHKTLTLPSAPLTMEIAPDGKTAACLYAYFIVIFDTETANILATLKAEESALAEVAYLDTHTILYAGNGGLKAYDIESNRELWTGKPATSISISGDKKSVAAVYKEENFATVYDTANGQIKYTVDFEQKYQSVTVNDKFANPNDNLLALNNQGTLLGVSFEDGSLQIYNLEEPSKDILLFDEMSDYFHFEGGFYQQYFAFSATDKSSSVFAVIDTDSLEQTGGFESESAFSVQTDENGIYLQQENILVKIHPVTGEQSPLVTTDKNIQHFARSEHHTLITTPEEYLFFDKNANFIISYEKVEPNVSSDFIQIAEEVALIGNSDSPMIRIMKYENHPDTELFSYDPSYRHDEVRMSADGNTFMLFTYDQFRLYGKDGKLIKEETIPNASQVYDQQYRREREDSYLEVIYNDGTISAYSAKDGSLLYEKEGERPDGTFQEEFYTEKLVIQSPLHGSPAAYDRKTGKLLRQFEEDAYLTYVTQAGSYIVVQYVTADGYYYGQLLNEKCEVLANLPYLCDVVKEDLIFDYPTGNIRESRIYKIDELIEMAQNKKEGGN